MKALYLIFLGYVGVSCTQLLQNDLQAYNYCLHNPESFIAIVWPIAQGKDTLIKNILNRYGKIVYQKNFYFTKLLAHTILQLAHQHIPSNQPHCGSLKEHVKWYFPKSVYQHPARIFVVHFDNAALALKAKYAVRKLFPDLQYRSIHINDYHAETVQLADFFLR